MDPAQTNNHKYTSFVRCLECLEGCISQSVKWLDSQPGHQSVNQIGPVLLTTTRASFFSTRPVKVLQVLVANSSGHSALQQVFVTYHNIPRYIMPHRHPCRCSNSFIDVYLFSCLPPRMKNEFSLPRGDQYRSGSPGVAFLCVLTFCRKDGSPSA